jgi:opacity protein-like surface antigen
MIKKGILILLMLAFAAGPAFAAPDRTGKLDMGVNVSAAFSTDSDIDDTIYVGGSWSYGIYEWLAIGFEAGWMEADTEVELAGASINTGDIAGIPVFGDFIFRAPMGDQPLNPYAVVGVGAVFWDIDESHTIADAGYEVDADSSFAMKFGGGVDWFVTSNWIVYFEGAYVLADADISVRRSDGSEVITDEESLDFWTVGGGIKYLFG